MLVSKQRKRGLNGQETTLPALLHGLTDFRCQNPNKDLPGRYLNHEFTYAKLLVKLISAGESEELLSHLETKVTSPHIFAQVMWMCEGT
jgi:hypothetical protein